MILTDVNQLQSVQPENTKKLNDECFGIRTQWISSCALVKVPPVCTRKIIDWNYILGGRLCRKDAHLSSSLICGDVPKKPPNQVRCLFFYNLVILFYHFTAVDPRRPQYALPTQKNMATLQPIGDCNVLFI